VEFELPNDLRLGLYLREGFARNVGQTSLLVPEGGLTSTEVYFQTDDLARLIAQLESSRGSQAKSTGAARLATAKWNLIESTSGKETFSVFGSC
jgi:hypothetical protein